MSKPRIIAFYLPQFHPFKENDEWWGKGFTEWTNVAKAKPLFKGHYQPKIPADLGFYDLRVPEVREEQAKLAKEAGIYAFCYWHYWFGNGKTLMDMPFNEVLKSGKPDFPFCLAWANHSWYAKTWNPDVPDKLLIEQNYPGIKDNEAHFYSLLSAFKDSRYIRIDNKPVFVVFKPLKMPGVSDFIQQWQVLAKANGLEGLYFIGQGTEVEVQEILSLGFDAVNHEEINKIHARHTSFVRLYKQIKRRILNRPRCYDYLNAMSSMISPVDIEENVYPTICPNYDHTPRSGNRGLVYTNSTPEKFAIHVHQVLDIVKDKHNKYIFLKSWNEWGEGNYMEPDLKFGKGYINELKKTMNDL